MPLRCLSPFNSQNSLELVYDPENEEPTEPEPAEAEANKITD